MKTQRRVLLGVSLIASACSASHRAAFDENRPSVVDTQGGAGGQSAARNEAALSDAAGASGTALAGTGGLGGALASGVTAGEPAAAGMVDVDDVRRDCAETLQCASMSGAVVSTVADCVAASLEALNGVSAAAQLHFKQLFDACISFKACEYQACTER
jgi:hypothetical protein